MGNLLTGALFYEGTETKGYAIALTAAYDLADGKGVRCEALGALEASETGDPSLQDFITKIEEILSDDAGREWKLDEDLWFDGVFRLVGPRKGQWAVITVGSVSTALTPFALDKLIEPCEAVRVKENLLDELRDCLQDGEITQGQYDALADDGSLNEMAERFFELRADDDGEWEDRQYVVASAIENLPDEIPGTEDGKALGAETDTAGTEDGSMAPVSAAGPEGEAASPSIREVAYELYKTQWTLENLTRDELLDSMRNWAEESREFGDRPSFVDWAEDTGFGYGGCYVCYEEFLGAEYLDAGFMKELLGSDALIAEYEADVKELTGEPGASDGTEATAPDGGEADFFSSEAAFQGFLEGKNDEPLNFPACCFLLDEAAKSGVVMRDPKDGANVLVYRNAGDEGHPEGWYSENLMSAAGELSDSPEGQRLMRDAILKARAGKEAG